MDVNKSLPVRKRIRLSDFDYTQKAAYFVTVCTADRKPYFRDVQGTLTPIGRLTEKSIRSIPTHYANVTLDIFCIMPDHVHLILIFETNAAVSLSTVIGQFKRYVSKHAELLLWQKSFYEHVIRNETDYQEKWQYIQNNPVRLDVSPA